MGYFKIKNYDISVQLSATLCYIWYLFHEKDSFTKKNDTIK